MALLDTSLGALRAIAPSVAQASALLRQKNEKLSDCLNRLLQPRATVSIEGGGRTDGSGIVRFATWDGFMNHVLRRGLVGLLRLQSVLFLWDQCFLAGFDQMLPLALVALQLSFREELMSYRRLSTAVESFQSYCREDVSGPRLLKLLTAHCSVEMLKLSGGDRSLSADSAAEEDAVLDEIYGRLRQHELTS